MTPTGRCGGIRDVIREALHVNDLCVMLSVSV